MRRGKGGRDPLSFSAVEAVDAAAEVAGVGVAFSASAPAAPVFTAAPEPSAAGELAGSSPGTEGLEASEEEEEA